jgi:hypothetical protein
MNLRHGTVDAPMGAKSSPAADELLFGFREFHKTKLQTVSEFSKIIENIFLTVPDREFGKLADEAASGSILFYYFF